MPAFEYTAVDAQGQRKKGVIEGDTARQVRQQLRSQGLFPLEINPATETLATKAFGFSRGKRITVAELALITRQLATLLSAGMPLEEVLLTVAEQAEKTLLKSMMMAIRAKVMEGLPLAVALGNFPRAFSPVFCASVAAGEQTGYLDTVLTRLADYTEQQQHMQQKIQQALIYPSIMMLVSMAIVGFLLTYVVPRITGVFIESGQALPILTQILIGGSEFLKNNGVYLVIFMAILIGWFRHLLQNPTHRLRWHAFLLKIPLIRHLAKTINTARFARTFGILTGAGTPVLEAMRVSTQVIMNLPLQAAVQEAAHRVREGVSIHHALKQTAYFSPISIHLIASGEASGQLETMLERVANHQDLEVARWVETGLALFEPVLILTMGTVVLFIVLAILLPIFSLNQLIG